MIIFSIFGEVIAVMISIIFLDTFMGDRDLFYRFGLHSFGKLFVLTAFIGVVGGSAFSILFQPIERTTNGAMVYIVIGVIGGFLLKDEIPERGSFEYEKQIRNPCKVCPQGEWLVSVRYEEPDINGWYRRDSSYLGEFKGDEAKIDSIIAKEQNRLLKENPKRKLVEPDNFDKLLLGVPKKWLKENNLPLEMAMDD